VSSVNGAIIQSCGPPVISQELPWRIAVPYDVSRVW